MTKPRICIIFFLISVLKTFAQGNNIQNAKIDVFLDPTIIKSTELENVLFQNHIDISTSQNLIIASHNAFYRIGYGDYAISKTMKEIHSFCFIKNKLFYSNNRTLYEISDSGKEREALVLNFPVKQLWGGKDIIYAVSSVNEENTIYAISPETSKCIKIHTIQHPILGISELGTVLFVLYENGLQTLFVNKKRFIDIPLRNPESGKLISMAIDKRKGSIYIASENGVYRFFKKKLELIYKGSGFLCDDLDGLLIFAPQSPLLLRLRNETLYPNDSINIEIK